MLAKTASQTGLQHPHIKDGEVEEEAHAVQAHSQDVLQLADHSAGILQREGQVLASLIGGHHCIPHILQVRSFVTSSGSMSELSMNSWQVHDQLCMCFSCVTLAALRCAALCCAVLHLHP